MSEPLLTALLLLLYTFVLPLAGAGGVLWLTRRWSSVGRIAPAHRGALAFLVAGMGGAAGNAISPLALASCSAVSTPSVL